MRKYIAYLFFGVMLVFSVSCKKSFLEIVPQGSQVAQITEDYDKLMNLTEFYYIEAGGLQEVVPLGDEVAADVTYLNQGSVLMTRLFQWEADIYKTSYYDQVPLLLKTQLEQMYTLNKVIAEVMGSTGGTEAQKKAIRAEALATRAHMNFLFINLYAKPYLASSANTDPGFPLIKTYEITQSKYDRATVQAMYDFIISDLTAAVADVPLKPRIVTRWSKPAVKGFLGKVYVFMGNYTAALPLIRDALNEVATNGEPALYDYNTEFADPDGSFLPIDPVNGPTGPGNNPTDLREAVLSKVFYNGPFHIMYGNDGLVLTPEAQALYGYNDLRLLLYTEKTQDGSLNPNRTLRKYGVKYSRMGLQLTDLYLLSAECKARLGDLDGARADVETLRQHRMPAPDASVPDDIAASQTAWIKFIIDERTREFAMEGYRWFDMRRLSVDPLFAGEVHTHTLYNENGTTTLFTLEPNRLVMRFPPYITLRNPDMPNNP